MWGRTAFLDLIQLRCFVNSRCSIKCILLVTGKSLGLFQGKGFFSQNDPLTTLCVLLLPFSKKRKCENHDPAPSTPNHVLSASRSCVKTGDGKMKEGVVVVNHSKDRRKTKWGMSHGHGLILFSQLKRRGSPVFPASVSPQRSVFHSYESGRDAIGTERIASKTGGGRTWTSFVALTS